MIQLDTSRFFSDRIVFDGQRFEALSGVWEWMQRLISWICSPCAYSEENRRTVECFRTYLVDRLGEARLQRISSRYQIDWGEMQKNPLLSRDVAKFVVAAQCVTVEDVQEVWGRDFSELGSEELAEIIQRLASPFRGVFEVADLSCQITGRPTEFLARVWHDPLLADRERQQVMREHPQDSFENFMHNMVVRVIKREPALGMLIPAPNHEGRPQFYYVSGKLATGRGMVSYILHPATRDTQLEPIRLFRGTSTRNSELDALSTVITDLERDLGRSAYQSGLPYEQRIQQRLGVIAIEGGHSMGSNLVQHRLAAMDHIRTAYLYAGPGITMQEVTRFNERNPHVHLIIRQANSDRASRVGQTHLGYQAPSNVQVDFLNYQQTATSSLDPHVAIWGLEEDFIAENGEEDALYHVDGCEESFRICLGPIVARMLEWVRDFMRYCFSSRIAIEQGLQIGRLQNHIWQVEHFRCV